LTTRRFTSIIQQTAANGLRFFLVTGSGHELRGSLDEKSNLQKMHIAFPINP
jgi:hypothetical protein